MEKAGEIARCGLACFLCSKKEECRGCHDEGCAGSVWCEVRKCCTEKGLAHCCECGEAGSCRKGVLSKLKPHTFTAFAQKYGIDRLTERLESNEKCGIVYHRSGISGDYDECSNEAELMELIETGKLKQKNN